MNDLTRFRIVLPAVLNLVFAVDALCQPSLSAATRQGLPPGKTVELYLHGRGFEGDLRIWCATSARIEQIAPEQDGKRVKLRMTVSADAPVGVTGLVAANAQGASDPLLVMVDDMDSVSDNEANHHVLDAQAISLPLAVDGHSDGVQADYYRFHGQTGQRISIEAVAQRIASSMDPVIRLLDPQCDEVALADDDPGLGADCRVQHVCEQTGDYLIEVRDNRFQAGGAYRLRVGDFPMLTSPVPSGGRRGSTAVFRFAGPDAKQVSPLILRIPHRVPTGWLGMAVRASGGASSTLTAVAASDLPEFVESEPDDGPHRSTRVTLPCAVSGILQSENDQDDYEFAVTKGERIDFAAYGRRLGSPAFVVMTLYDSDGNSVAKTTVGESEEWTLSHIAGADGLYRLAAHDLLRRGGQCFAYRIEMRNGPDFSLALKNDQNSILKQHLSRGDGACGLTVQAQRRGYQGPIHLKLEPADEGLRIYNHVIPANANEVRIFLVASTNSKEADLHMIRVVGTADIDGHDVLRRMETEAKLRAKMPHVLYPPPWYSGLITAAIVGPQEPLFDIQSDQESIALSAGSGKYVFHLQRKAKGFEAGIKVFFEGLPKGVEASAKAEKDKYTVTITSGTRDPRDEFRLRVVNIGEHQNRGQTSIKDILVKNVAKE